MSQLQVADSQALMGYQIAIRAHTDIRNPPRGFVAALADEFGRAAEWADGRMCVTVPYAVAGDDTREAVETVLHAAAAHREANTRVPVRVQVTGTHYTAQRTCHVLALCEISPAVQSTPQQIGTDPAIDLDTA
jgi:hypothetical protein